MQGSLSREVVRRVVRRHLNEIRSCYEQSGATRAGRVSVRFVIAADGSIRGASIASSTLNDAGAESCITAAVRRWTFPAPQGGGVVTVVYPFELRPAADRRR